MTLPFCIELTDTCCPDQSGGCGIGDRCVLDDNNNYGCCAIGLTCTGTVTGTNTIGGSFPTSVFQTTRTTDNSNPQTNTLPNSFPTVTSNNNGGGSSPSMANSLVEARSFLMASVGIVGALVGAIMVFTTFAPPSTTVK